MPIPKRLSIFDDIPGFSGSGLGDLSQQQDSPDTSNMPTDPQSYIDDALAALNSMDDQSSDPQSDIQSGGIQGGGTAGSQPPVATGGGAASTGSDQDALNWIIQHESGGRTTAKNPKSSAFGIGQLLDYNRASYAKQLGIKDPNTTNPDEQRAMMNLYIKQRYGTPTQAKAFWESHGWY